jgi:hypothetical protein
VIADYEDRERAIQDARNFAVDFLRTFVVDHPGTEVFPRQAATTPLCL